MKPAMPAASAASDAFGSQRFNGPVMIPLVYDIGDCRKGIASRRAVDPSASARRSGKRVTMEIVAALRAVTRTDYGRRVVGC